MHARPIYVLLLESDRQEAKLVQRTLEAAGGEFLLTIANRVARADELLAATQFDIVLVGMAGGCPVTVAEGLQRNADLPFIILSRDDDAELRSRALRAGAQDYLVMEREGRLLLRAIRFAIERHRSSAGVREREERYALALRGSKEGLWDWDLLSQEAHFSDRWMEIVGRENEEMAAVTDWFDLVHADDLPRLQADLEWHFKGLSSHFENEHRLRHRDGDYRWVVCCGVVVQDASGRNRRMAGSLADISSRKAHEEKLQWSALHDDLTGLPNRALLLDRLGITIAHAQRRDEFRFAVLYLDLDGFKEVNDSYGHLVGDRLLTAVAGRLTSTLRPGDTVARMGGDEFAVLAHDVPSPERVERLTDRILSSFATPFEIGDRLVTVGVSVGVAMSGQRYEEPEQILRDADMALYRAKMEGKGRSAQFSAVLDDGGGEYLQLEEDLRHAIDAGELILHYQPIVALSTDRLVGFEALVRWHHSERGLLYPADFVPLAEETGLVLRLGEWVLREACTQMATWQRDHLEARNLTMGVNLSPNQFRRRDLVDRIWGLVEETGVEAKSLQLDVTEAMLMKDPEAAMTKVSELKALGIGVHVDDFGTGPASLGHLRRLPGPTLKIDRSFVSAVDSGATPNVQVVGALVTLARALGMDVSAEGLETAAQVSAFRDLDCDFGQGHFFARALAAAEATQLVAGERSLDSS